MTVPLQLGLSYSTSVFRRRVYALAGPSHQISFHPICRVTIRSSSSRRSDALSRSARSALSVHFTDKHFDQPLNLGLEG
ncbi:hypothetical protein PILCRDRAFT_391129 [Piloderma croceum F 1598]|uniref:Uncharacterized protein n=1 Tax=Piloderma croceum (strain F 1598) TaxID=765440 RepID=A0A0C3C4U5_PILCF|nr:hypothetical protein PILCRDRAFT_391129 [Piloderma croceum F 1598]